MISCAIRLLRLNQEARDVSFYPIYLVSELVLSDPHARGAVWFEFEAWHGPFG